LRKSFPENWADYYGKLLRVYDLADLARRPILLELIVTILPGIDESDVVTEAAIYGTAIQLWLGREAWRGVDPDEVIAFMKSLAVHMFLNDLVEINFRDLAEEVRRQFHSRILASIDLDRFDSLIRTSSFISRDAQGNFFFMHRSFMEYFFALALQDGIREGKLKLIRNNNVPELYFMSLSYEDRARRDRAAKALREKLKVRADKVYALTDGIVELLESSLNQHFPDHQVTNDVHAFAADRIRFREQQRKLDKIAHALRGRGVVERNDWDDVVERVTMVGGEGRIYYTVDHYSFNLLVNSEDINGEWVFLLGKWQDWRHT
jgi:hypothetical protein